MSNTTGAPGEGAQHLETPLDWSDLVIDRAVRDDVTDIVTWIKHADTLMKDWKLAGRLKPGWRSLFVGPPGTGKRLTALLIGKTVGRDVYRADLFRITSKDANETLDALLAQAQAGNWILLVELADAFFDDGANGRATNQKTAYLLQRLEDFPGVVIVTSNLATLADEAFARRFESVIKFRMPDAGEREQIWKDALASVPGGTDIDLKKLARDHELSGGDIGAVLRMACLRAVRHLPPFVTMAYLEDAVKQLPGRAS